MRLFVGVPLGAEVANRVNAFVDRLRPLAELRWSHADDLHVTTKFLGEQPSSHVAAIEHALRTLPSRAKFVIDVRRVGWFPDEREPRVFWAGIEASRELACLAADTERALAPLGVAIEHRAFTPHVTLARVPKRASLRSLREAPDVIAATEFGAFTVERFVLYESRGAGEGARYQPIAEVAFAAISRP